MLASRVPWIANGVHLIVSGVQHIYVWHRGFLRGLPFGPGQLSGEWLVGTVTCVLNVWCQGKVLLLLKSRCSKRGLRHAACMGAAPSFSNRGWGDPPPMAGGCEGSGGDWGCTICIVNLGQLLFGHVVFSGKNNTTV